MNKGKSKSILKYCVMGLAAFFILFCVISSKTGTKDSSLGTSKDIDVIKDSIVDVFKNPNTNSERVTQTLFGEPIKIIEEISEWSKVEVKDGYTGWIKSNKINKAFKNTTLSKVIIKSKFKNVYSDRNDSSFVIQICLGTELFCIGKTDKWYEVALPMNTTGWIKDEDTELIKTGTSIPKTTGSKFVETAKKFIGVPYLWGGVSSRGIDCSGLTYMSCLVNGVDLPRDAQPQYEAIHTAIKPTIEDMKTGDLIFFSAEIGSSRITHVGIYIGNDKFIQASSGDGIVTITSLSNRYYKERIVGVRRAFEE